MPTSEQRVRCRWPGNPLSVAYHDEEWGVPVHDDRTFLSFLPLREREAGLSWDTLLKARKGDITGVFANFDAKKVARFDRKKVATLMKDAGIVRNRLKIESTISNAKAFLAVQKEFGSFDKYVWKFVDGQPLQNNFKEHKGLPAKTKESDALSKDLQKRGFRFVGSTICYAFMQAVGMSDE